MSGNIVKKQCKANTIYSMTSFRLFHFLNLNPTLMIKASKHLLCPIFCIIDFNL